jgi:hypothetical protein
MITGLYMGWTDPVTLKWFPIKKMTWDRGKYYSDWSEKVIYEIATLLNLPVARYEFASLSTSRANYINLSRDYARYY